MIFLQENLLIRSHVSFLVALAAEGQSLFLTCILLWNILSSFGALITNMI